MFWHNSDFYSGNVDDDTLFTYDVDTEVEASCAATLNDEFWVIGGYSRKRQVCITPQSWYENYNR